MKNWSVAWWMKMSNLISSIRIFFFQCGLLQWIYFTNVIFTSLLLKSSAYEFILGTCFIKILLREETVNCMEAPPLVSQFYCWIACLTSPYMIFKQPRIQVYLQSRIKNHYKWKIKYLFVCQCLFSCEVAEKRTNIASKLLRVQ